MEMRLQIQCFGYVPYKQMFDHGIWKGQMLFLHLYGYPCFISGLDKKLYNGNHITISSENFENEEKLTAHLH